LVHRDIKPENILLEKNVKDSNLKLINFGTSLSFNDPTALTKEVVGTVYYIAPEVMTKDYDYKCDLWSCGVIMYILLCGKPPFNGGNDEEVLYSVMNDKINFDSEIWNEVSKEAKSLLMGLLDRDSNTRKSAAEALESRWFTIMLGKKKIGGKDNFENNQMMIKNLKSFNG